MMRAVMLVALLAGCAGVVGSQPRAVPPELTSCPPAAPKPQAPPTPRTIESLADGYNRLQGAREATEAARNACASKLRQLNEFVKNLR